MKKLLASLLLAGSVFQANAVSIQEFATLLQAEPSEVTCVTLLTQIDELLTQAPSAVERVIGEAFLEQYNSDLVQLKKSIEGLLPIRIKNAREALEMAKVNEKRIFSETKAGRKDLISMRPLTDMQAEELAALNKKRDDARTTREEAQKTLRIITNEKQLNQPIVLRQLPVAPADQSVVQPAKPKKTWGQTFAKGAKVAAVTAAVAGLAKRYIFSPSK